IEPVGPVAAMSATWAQEPLLGSRRGTPTSRYHPRTATTGGRCDVGDGEGGLSRLEHETVASDTTATPTIASARLSGGRMGSVQKSIASIMHRREMWVSAVGMICTSILGDDIEVQEDVARVRSGAITAPLTSLKRSAALPLTEQSRSAVLLDPDDLGSPPFDLVVVGRRYDLAQRRERSIPRPGTQNMGQVDGSRIVDAVSGDRALQHRGFDSVRGDEKVHGIDRALHRSTSGALADLASTGGQAQRWLRTVEVLGVEEVNRLALQPSVRVARVHVPLAPDRSVPGASRTTDLDRPTHRLKLSVGIGGPLGEPDLHCVQRCPWNTADGEGRLTQAAGRRRRGTGSEEVTALIPKLNARVRDRIRAEP